MLPIPPDSENVHFFMFWSWGLYKVLQDHSLNVVTADYQLRSKFKYYILTHLKDFDIFTVKTLLTC